MPGFHPMSKSKFKPKGKRVNATGRNDREQFIPLPYTMLHHPAWRGLGGAAIKVFLELRSRFNGRNNGDLSLSGDEAARLLKMSKSTVARAFAELDSHGFIRKVTQGQWYGRLATTWRTTDLPCDGNLATRDWQHWRPDRKTEIGTVAAPLPSATVPPEYREKSDGTATVPVSTISTPATVPLEYRLYSHREGKEGRSAEPMASAARSPEEGFSPVGRLLDGIVTKVANGET